MYEDITKAIPRVRIMSGDKGHGCRIFIDERELQTATDIKADLSRGCFSEVTVKFTALITNEEPKKPNEITVKVNVDTDEAKDKLKELAEDIRKSKALGYSY